MADSPRPQDRDDEVPDPPDRDHVQDGADRDGCEPGRRGRQEPDRGMPWMTLMRLVVEVILPHVEDIIALINGNGG